MKNSTIATVLAVLTAAAGAHAGGVEIEATATYGETCSNLPTVVVDADYDAGGADKLVVAITTQDGWSGSQWITGVRYGGVSLTEAVQRALPPDDPAYRAGAAAIFYLDNPGPAGAIEFDGTRVNGHFTAVYALSNTVEGHGATGDDQDRSTSLTTTAGGSLVIAQFYDEGFRGPAWSAAEPLTEVGGGGWGTGGNAPWGYGVAGYLAVDDADTAVTPTFTTATIPERGFVTVAAEFLAAPPRATLIALR